MRVLDVHRVNYAFIKNKNCALNAMQHIGYRFNLSIDITDFFQSVSLDHVEHLIRADVLRDCFLHGAPQQGLPTSPAIANIALTPCDKKIVESLAAGGIECVYTRYADDLSFSFDKIEDAQKIEVLASQILSSAQFNINSRKTKLQALTNGRVIINGIGIDADGLHPTRKTKKKLRAALHQGNKDSPRGLIEWAKCRLPQNLIR